MAEKKSDKTIYLSRDLKFYKWSVVGEKNKIPDLVLYDKRRHVIFQINKVYVMSLHKFIPNYLDKIRIIQVKRLKSKKSKVNQIKGTKKDEQ